MSQASFSSGTLRPAVGYNKPSNILGWLDDVARQTCTDSAPDISNWSRKGRSIWKPSEDDLVAWPRPYGSDAGQFRIATFSPRNGEFKYLQLNSVCPCQCGGPGYTPVDSAPSTWQSSTPAYLFNNVLSILATDPTTALQICQISQSCPASAQNYPDYTGHWQTPERGYCSTLESVYTSGSTMAPVAPSDNLAYGSDLRRHGVPLAVTSEITAVRDFINRTWGDVL